MKVAALIFDVDGTLADTEELHRLAFNAAFESLGLDWHWDRTEYRQLLKTTGGKERLARFIAASDRADDEKARWMRQVPAIHAEKTRRYAAAMQATPVAPREGVKELLSEAREAGMRLAIASTTSPENVNALLDATLGGPNAPSFEIIACGDEVAHKKPAPDVYELALGKLGLTPEHAIAFEDSAAGLRSATAAGLWTVVTPNFWTEGEDFTQAGLLRDSLHGLSFTELLRLRQAVHA